MSILFKLSAEVSTGFFFLFFPVCLCSRAKQLVEVKI